MDDRLLTRLKVSSRVIAALVIIASFISLVGWSTGNYALTRLIPNLGGAIPFTGKLHSAAGINLILLSLGLFLIGQSKNPKLKMAGYAAPAIVFLSCLLALYEGLSGSVLDNIRILAPSDVAPGITYPTPMILEVTITLTVLAVALSLLNLRNEMNFTPSQIASLVSTPIPLLILIGAATQSPKLCALGGCFEMSLAFALLTLSMAVAIVLSNPEVGFIKLFASTTIAGRFLRRAAILIAVVPSLLLVRVIMVNYKVNNQPLVEAPLSWALFGVSLVGITAYLIVSGAKNLDLVEAERSEIEDELVETRKALSDSFKAQTIKKSHIRYKKVCLTCTREFSDEHEVCPVDGDSLDRIVNESLEGQLFADKYQIDTVLGEGGMSVVYKAVHKDLDRKVAIKVLKGSSNASSLARFKREAKLTSTLTHKNIVGVSDFGISEEGRSYIVMEYVEGESLSDLLDRIGRLKPKVACYLIDQICDGLIHAHDKGIVHRDLKPANVMLVKNEEGGITAKIVDFGLAKILDEDIKQSQKLTQTGECFGSPLYMSPQQCLGESVDYQADIYALGCIAYELLTGAPPLIGDSILDTFSKQVNESPPPLPKDVAVPKEWAAAIFIALAKKAEHRQKHVSEFKDAFSVLV